MAQENLKLTKTIYSTKSTDGLIDRSFSEFFKTKNPVDINKFFSLYNELFYEIPKQGDKSHESIIKQSKEYVKNYSDDRDIEIKILSERIADLENLLDETTEEHPFYANGSILAEEDAQTVIHYMDRGQKRRIMGNLDGTVYKALKASLGFPKSTNNDDIITVVPNIILKGIPKGPKLDIEDLTGASEREKFEQQQQQLASTIVNNWRIELKEFLDPLINNTILGRNQYVEYLKEHIKNAFQQEQDLEILRNKYADDRDRGYTEEERQNGQRLLNILNPKLQRSRQTLAILKRFWDRKLIIPTSEDLDNILPQTIVNNEGEIVGDKAGATQVNPITEEELNSYEGWQEGRSLFEGVLTGNEYFAEDPLIFQSNEANTLLEQGIIKVRYKKERFTSTGFGGGYYVNNGFEEKTEYYPEEPYESENYRYTFDKYIYA